MLENIQSALKKRAIAVFVTVHIGLVLGIVTLARSSYASWDLTTSLFLATVILLYGSFVMAVLFILMPLLPWLRKAQQVEHWTDRLLRDLPLLLGQLPKIVEAIQAIVATWNDAKPKSHSHKTARKAAHESNS